MVMARDMGSETSPNNSESEREESEGRTTKNEFIMHKSFYLQGAPAARLTTTVEPPRVLQTERAGRNQSHHHPRRRDTQTKTRKAKERLVSS